MEESMFYHCKKGATLALVFGSASPFTYMPNCTMQKHQLCCLTPFKVLPTEGGNNAGVGEAVGRYVKVRFKEIG